MPNKFLFFLALAVIALAASCNGELQNSPDTILPWGNEDLVTLPGVVSSSSFSSVLVNLEEEEEENEDTNEEEEDSDNDDDDDDDSESLNDSVSLARDVNEADDEDVEEANEAASQFTQSSSSPALDDVSESLDASLEALIEDDDDLSATESETDDESDDIAEENELAAEEHELLVENCREAVLCRQQQEDHLAQDVAEAETKRKTCEAANVAAFASAKKTFDDCVVAAAANCTAQHEACIKKHAQFESEAKSVGISAGEVPCKPCGPSSCAFNFVPVKCDNATSSSIPPTAQPCGNYCQQLCPAQEECELRNRKSILEFREALVDRDVQILRCQRDNAAVGKLLTSFAAKCERQNNALLAKCARTANKARQLAAKSFKASTAASSLATSFFDLPCPTIKCVVPDMQLTVCDFPEPPTPKLTSCVDLCTTAECAERASCERANDEYLRKLAHYERVVNQCEVSSSKAVIANQAKNETCAQKKVLHIASCQIAHTAAIMKTHSILEDCITSKTPDQWDTCKQAAANVTLPFCPPYSCYDLSGKVEPAPVHVNTTTTAAATNGTAFLQFSDDAMIDEIEIDEEPTTVSTSNSTITPAPTTETVVVADCKRKYASVRPNHQILQHCEQKCSTSMYAKFRGESAFLKELHDFKNSKVFTDYSLYLEHRAKCLNEECKAISDREWRRALFNCPPGEDGQDCREKRKFKGVLIHHQVQTILKFEKKIKECPEGKVGRTCRRVLTALTRKKMYSCPANQSIKYCNQYLRNRQVRILKKCGADGSSFLCRRTRRECVEQYGKLRSACPDSDAKCRKISWDLVKEKCFMEA